MAPRSWKPDSSLGATIADDQMALQLEQGAKDYSDMLAADAHTTSEQALAVREATLTFSLASMTDGAAATR